MKGKPVKMMPTRKTGIAPRGRSRRNRPLGERAPRFGLNGSSPFKIRNILVPVDFSDCSKKALQYAVAFARQFNAALTLLYVAPTYYLNGEFAGGIDLARLEKELREAGEQQLADWVVREVDEFVTTKTVVRLGRPAEAIADAARQLEVDLIILSTHGRSGLKHVFLGSVAENVVRHAPCPILVVREHEHEFIAG
jgi:nucleotide-binding universal stress UspA family protein